MHAYKVFGTVPVQYLGDYNDMSIIIDISGILLTLVIELNVFRDSVVLIVIWFLWLVIKCIFNKRESNKEMCDSSIIYNKRFKG